MSKTSITVPSGIVAITTYGPILADTAAALLAMQQRLTELQIRGIQFIFVPGNLADKARDEAAQMLLNTQHGWVTFIDADMQFEPTLLERLLTTAYGTHAQADIVGGWCCLGGDPYLPTIDTGTGTWEATPANVGVLPVIRTGGACLLIKRHVFERVPYPWFGIRYAGRPIDAMAEVDSFARQLYDGRNPLADKAEWNKLFDIASTKAQEDRARNPTRRDDLRVTTVGEDSGFCDKAHAYGMKIVVDTHAVCKHLKKQALGPDDHANAMKRLKAYERQAAGLTA